MEKVYIALIIGAAIVIVVFLLRSRITDVEAHGSVKKQEGRFKIKAAPAASEGSGTADPYSVDISGNRVVGVGRFRILRDSVRVARNWFAGKSTLEVEPDQEKKRK